MQATQAQAGPSTASPFSAGQPQPTFRHLYANGPAATHVSNPLRVVSHVDIDAAYAQFEIKRLGIDPAKPVAVQQWQGLIAIN